MCFLDSERGEECILLFLQWFFSSDFKFRFWFYNVHLYTRCSEPALAACGLHIFIIPVVLNQFSFNY